MELDRVVEEIRLSPGIQNKSHISLITEVLREVGDFGRTLIGFGDDSAVLEDGDGYLLMAAEGMLPELVKRDPYFSGWSSVVASTNDIYAMGGRPLALVNILWMEKPEDISLVAQGMRDSCRQLRVPMVGGHLNTSSGFYSLAVAIVGRGRSLLLSNTARRGEAIILALDLNGRPGTAVVRSWNSHQIKDSDKLVRDLELLPSLAEDGLVKCARDISNAGILGTIASILERSKVGGWIDLSLIKPPPGFSEMDWYQVFPSYGFIITTSYENSRKVTCSFQKRDIAAQVIGEVIEEPKMILRYNHQEKVLFDWEKQRFFS